MNRLSIKSTVAWVIGASLVLIGVMGISGKYFFGPLFLIISGILTIPPTFIFINTKLKNKLSMGLRIFLAIILFFVGIKYYPISTTNNNLTSDNAKQELGTQQSETKINTNVDTDTVEERGTVVSVTDGDTLRVKVAEKEMVIRLIGIDTPEISHPTEPIQCYGPEAKKALEELILNKEVVLEKDISDKDKYDRYLRYIWVGEIMVNEYLTQNGYAFASTYPPDIKYQSRINAGEQSAKTALRGLWAKETCNGDVYTGTYKDPNIKSITASTQPSTTTKPAYVAPVVPVNPPGPTNNNSTGYVCNCSKTCTNMASCEEAYFQLNNCGCSARDGDDDGIPCESICN